MSGGQRPGEPEPGSGRRRQAEDELVDVAVPRDGRFGAEGTVLEWRVAVGDAVAVDECSSRSRPTRSTPRCPAVAGTVAELLVEPDSTVPSGRALPHHGRCRGARRAGRRPAAAPGGRGRARAPRRNGARTPRPVAARIASAHGLDVGSVKGSGPRGRVTKEDVLGGARGQRRRPRRPTAAPRSSPIRGPAATLARFMNESRSIPTATSFRTLTVDVLDARRRALKAAGQASSPSPT